jgi:hypothetical protein
LYVTEGFMRAGRPPSATGSKAMLPDTARGNQTASHVQDGKQIWHYLCHQPGIARIYSSLSSRQKVGERMQLDDMDGLLALGG